MSFHTSSHIHASPIERQIMNPLAIVALVILYLLYTAFLVTAVRNISIGKATTPVTLSGLKGALVIEGIQLLCVLVLWLDHNPTSWFRLFLVVVLVGEIISESIRGIWHYKKSTPISSGPIFVLLEVVCMLILISLLAFVP